MRMGFVELEELKALQNFDGLEKQVLDEYVSKQYEKWRDIVWGERRRWWHQVPKFKLHTNAYWASKFWTRDSKKVSITFLQLVIHFSLGVVLNRFVFTCLKKLSKESPLTWLVLQTIASSLAIMFIWGMAMFLGEKFNWKKDTIFSYGPVISLAVTFPQTYSWDEIDIFS